MLLESSLLPEPELTALKPVKDPSFVRPSNDPASISRSSSRILDLARARRPASRSHDFQPPDAALPSCCVAASSSCPGAPALMSQAVESSAGISEKTVDNRDDDNGNGTVLSLDISPLP